MNTLSFVAGHETDAGGGDVESDRCSQALAEQLAIDRVQAQAI